MKWSYGITTVPSRMCECFPVTLDSLRRAGFDKPIVFVDGANGGHEYFGTEIVYRPSNVGTVANWILAILEVYLRDPHADRYAMFQDDFITYRNLRTYLESVPYPAKSYLNLYTFPQNQELCGPQSGFYRSNQNGLGAVALVFDREAIISLFSGSDHLMRKPTDRTLYGTRERGRILIDGGIVESMNKAGYTEYVHNPSLVQHIGQVSSMGSGRQQLAVSFRGEGFDAMNLLKAA